MFLFWIFWIHDEWFSTVQEKLPFFLSWVLATRPSERYPFDNFSEEEEDDKDEEAEEEEEGKESKLILFFNKVVWWWWWWWVVVPLSMSWTPNNLNLVSLCFWMVQVLELWPTFPQCEHFLTISLSISLSLSQMESQTNTKFFQKYNIKGLKRKG